MLIIASTESQYKGIRWVSNPPLDPPSPWDPDLPQCTLNTWHSIRIQEKYQGKDWKESFFLPRGGKDSLPDVIHIDDTNQDFRNEMEDGIPAANKETKGWMNRAETSWTLTFPSSSSISSPCQGPGYRGWQCPSNTFQLPTLLCFWTAPGKFILSLLLGHLRHTKGLTLSSNLELSITHCMCKFSGWICPWDPFSHCVRGWMCTLWFKGLGIWDEDIQNQSEKSRGIVNDAKSQAKDSGCQDQPKWKKLHTPSSLSSESW